MTRAIANRLPGPDNGFWDFVYPLVIVGLGVTATAAVFIQISSF